MAKYTSTVAEDGTITIAAPAATSMMDNVSNAVLAPLMPEGEYLDATGALWTAAVYGLAGVVGGSMLARKRVAEGKDPILKFIG